MNFESIRQGVSVLFCAVAPLFVMAQSEVADSIKIQELDEVVVEASVSELHLMFPHIFLRPARKMRLPMLSPC